MLCIVPCCCVRMMLPLHQIGNENDGDGSRRPPTQKSNDSFSFSNSSYRAKYEHVQDVLSNMKRLESTKYQRIHHVHEDAHHVFDLQWRRIILEWMHGVIEFCGLPRESVAAASYFLDFSLSHGLVKTRCDYQLVAMTALHLSLKLYDATLVKLESLHKLARNLFTEDDVIHMELKLCKALKWDLHPPTPGCFLHQYLELLPDQMSDDTRQTIQEATQMLCEMAVSRDEFRTFDPSIVAFAGMMLSIELLDETEVPTSQRLCFLFHMATVGQMDPQSMELHKAMETFKVHMKDNAKLMQLIETIGALPRKCRLDRVDYSKRLFTMTHTGTDNYSPRHANVTL